MILRQNEESNSRIDEEKKSVLPKTFLISDCLGIKIGRTQRIAIGCTDFEALIVSSNLIFKCSDPSKYSVIKEEKR